MLMKCLYSRTSLLYPIEPYPNPNLSLPTLTYLFLTVVAGMVYADEVYIPKGTRCNAPLTIAYDLRLLPPSACKYSITLSQPLPMISGYYPLLHVNTLSLYHNHCL